mgnify:CR=1 FL=1
MSRTVNSVINWIESSNYDIKTAEHMFETKRYVYVLFMRHLATEKLLKAVFEAALKNRWKRFPWVRCFNRIHYYGKKKRIHTLAAALEGHVRQSEFWRHVVSER